MKMLRWLHELEVSTAAMPRSPRLEEPKSDVGWANQIRSHVADHRGIGGPAHRWPRSATRRQVDGDLDPFLLESLKQGL